MINPPDWKQDQAETSRLPRKGKESAQTMLADKYEAGLRKMEAAGYEEFGEAIEDHKIVIAALRHAAGAPVAVREALDDINSHRLSWRRAIELARDHAPPRINEVDDRSYWEHELKAFDRTFAALATPEEASEPEEISGEEMDLIERNALALIRPEEASTAPKWANRPANSFPQMQEASTAAREAVAPSREVVEKALCCPKGCVREDDCFVSAPGAAVRYTRTSREHEQADAIMALYAAPPAAQTDGVRQALSIALELATEAFDHAESQDDHLLCEARYRTIESALSVSRPHSNTQE